MSDRRHVPLSIKSDYSCLQVDFHTASLLFAPLRHVSTTSDALDNSLRVQKYP